MVKGTLGFLFWESTVVASVCSSVSQYSSRKVKFPMTRKAHSIQRMSLWGAQCWVVLQSCSILLLTNSCQALYNYPCVLLSKITQFFPYLSSSSRDLLLVQVIIWLAWNLWKVDATKVSVISSTTKRHKSFNCLELIEKKSIIVMVHSVS